MEKQVFLLQGEYILRILVACICGIVIGYERENRNKEAGIRTHAIVALGAALIMVVSKYGFGDIVEYDASRVAAQIVSGIGFLGAGIIFVRNNAVSGLTTAAGIWATSGVGMAIGSGLYFVGIIIAVLIVFIQFLLHKQFILKKQHKYEQLELTVDGGGALGIKRLLEKLGKSNIEIANIEINRMNVKTYKIDLGVILPTEDGRGELTEILLECEDIHSVKY